MNLKSKNYKLSNKNKISNYNKKYKKLNPEVYANFTQERKNKKKFYASKRRGFKKRATPQWANLNKIKEIYLSCPEGMHVDHIIPLKGINEFKEHVVCGLHVEFNLQYLSAEENLLKGNKYYE